MRELRKYDEVLKLGRKFLLIVSFFFIDEQLLNILILVVQIFGLKILEFCLLYNLIIQRYVYVIFFLLIMYFSQIIN